MDMHTRDHGVITSLDLMAKKWIIKLWTHKGKENLECCQYYNLVTKYTNNKYAHT